jgi:hypothetical protein
MKVNKYFDLREFVDPVTYAELGDESIDLLDEKLFKISEFVRETINAPCFINTWHTGGQYKESGLRNKNTTTGAKKSAHKLGKGMDIKSDGYTGEEWYEFVKKHAKELYALGLRRIEDKKIATTWCHMDTKEHGKANVIQVIDLTEVVENINASGI